MDCFVAYSPLRKRFAFVAGNDDQTQLRDLAARYARVLLRTSRPLLLEGAGNAGRRCARSRAWCVVNTRVSHHGHTGNHPAFPAQWFYGLFRALPGDHALLTPSPARLLADLTPALGRQNDTTWPYASASFVRLALARLTPPASTASRPAFRDVRNAPLAGTRRCESVN